MCFPNFSHGFEEWLNALRNPMNWKRWIHGLLPLHGHHLQAWTFCHIMSHHVMSNISISSQIKSDYSAKNIAYRFVTGCIQEKLCYTLLTFGLSNLFVIPRRLPAFLFAFFLTPNPKPRNAGRGQCPILCWPCQMFFCSSIMIWVVVWSICTCYINYISYII